MTPLESPAAKPTWSDAFAVYLKPRVLIVILLGFSSGLPLALSGATLAIWMTESGVNLRTIGLYALVGLLFGVACALFAEPLIALAYGAKFQGFGATLIAWAPAYIFLGMTMPMESLVYARHALRGYFIIRGVASAVAIAICLPLIAEYQDLGAVAACAAGWLIAAAGTFVLLLRGTRQ